MAPGHWRHLNHLSIDELVRLVGIELTLDHHLPEVTGRDLASNFHRRFQFDSHAASLARWTTPGSATPRNSSAAGMTEFQSCTELMTERPAPNTVSGWTG